MTSGLRQAVVALLILILTLTAGGRGVAALALPLDPGDAVAGVPMPICHGEAGASSHPDDSGDPPSHGCCDACALLVPVVLPSAPTLSRAAPVSHAVAAAIAAGTRKVVTRQRGPRQAQGPPDA